MKRECDFLGELSVSVGWALSPPRNVTVFSFDPLSMHQQVSCNRITPTLSVSFSLFCFLFSAPSSLQFKCLEGIKTEDSRFFARTYESATGSDKRKIIETPIASYAHDLLLSIFASASARSRSSSPVPSRPALMRGGGGGGRG